MSEQSSNAASAAPAAQSEVVENQELNNEVLEGSEEGQEDQAQEPVKAAEVKKIEKQLKKLKLKVDGEEYEEEFDPNDDEYMTRQLQLAKMGQKRAAHSAALEKELIEFMHELKTNPKKALSKDFVGLDLKKFVAEYIEDEIAQSQKSPEQKEKEALEEELKAIKEQVEKEKQENRSKELESRRDAEAERYDILMENALKESDLPKTPYTVKKLAEYMLLSLENGVEMTPKELIPLVREEMQEDLKEMFAVMPEDVIEQLIGKDVFNRVRKKNIANAKKAPLTAKSIKEVSKQPVSKAPISKKTFKDFFGGGV